MDKHDLNHISTTLVTSYGLLVSVLIGVVGPIAGLAVGGFVLGLVIGAWLVHLHYRDPPSRPLGSGGDVDDH